LGHILFTTTGFALNRQPAALFEFDFFEPLPIQIEGSETPRSPPTPAWGAGHGRLLESVPSCGKKSGVLRGWERPSFSGCGWAGRVITSHTFTVVSVPGEARRWPSGLYAAKVHPVGRGMSGPPVRIPRAPRSVLGRTI